MNPRILLVGKGSFIGTNFIRHSRYRDITEVDVINQKPGDINLTGFDVVIHLAAIVHQTKKINYDEYRRVNTFLPIEMAKHAKLSGVKQFIFLSTSKVYGKYLPNQKPWNEDSVCSPNESYGISKLKAEEGLINLSDNSFSVTIIRTPLVYGEGVKANMLNLIKLVDKMPILPFLRITSQRSITYVGNLVGYLDRLIELNKLGVFIAKDEHSPSIEGLVGLISKSLGKRMILFYPRGITIKLLKIFFPQNHERLFGSSLLDNSKTLRVLDFVPEFSSEEGIDRTVKHYLKNKK